MAEPLRVVAIGGGTGLSSLLAGLKKYAHPSPDHSPEHPLLDITAVVTVTDDGQPQLILVYNRARSAPSTKIGIGF